MEKATAALSSVLAVHANRGSAYGTATIARVNLQGESHFARS